MQYVLNHHNFVEAFLVLYCVRGKDDGEYSFFCVPTMTLNVCAKYRSNVPTVPLSYQRTKHCCHLLHTALILVGGIGFGSPRDMKSCFIWQSLPSVSPNGTFTQYRFERQSSCAGAFMLHFSSEHECFSDRGQLLCKDRILIKKNSPNA